MEPLKTVRKYVISPVFWLGAWQLAAWGVGRELLLPGPGAVVRSLISLAGPPD